jgi:hypothetical protein
MGLLTRWLRSSPERATTSPRPLDAHVQQEPVHGVSSFHLWWEGMNANDPFVRCAATLEILTAPTARKLYFWALQASFEDAKGTALGGAHTGLQWNPSYPANRAVNWGGYDASGSTNAILKGSLSPLPSEPNDVNTRDYPWRSGVQYRFEIFHTDDGWQADVTDLSTGFRSVIRTLYPGGDRLTGFVCWSEVFASCGDPSAVVRWSDLSATTASGEVVHPSRVRLSFPAGGDCPNTDTFVDGRAVVQTTNTQRRSHDGERLRLS